MGIKGKHGIIKPINTTLNESMAYVIGVVCGDGSLRYYKEKNGSEHFCITLNVRDKEFRDLFVEKIENIKGHCNTFHDKQGGYVANATSKMLYNHLKSFNLNELLTASTEIKCAFLRGFYDSEGYVTVKEKKFTNMITVGLINKNKSLIDLCQKLLLSLGINSHVYKYEGSSFNPDGIYWQLMLFRKEDIKLFYEFVGFSIKRKQQKLEHCLKELPKICEICNKEFKGFQSMFLHRRWHFKRYKLPTTLGMRLSTETKRRISEKTKKRLAMIKVVRDEKGRFVKFKGDIHSGRM